MKICVFGLWHLGSVTAACLASMGHDVVGLDFDQDVVNGLRKGNPPIFEPGLRELMTDRANLHFTSEVAEAVACADVLWVTYDTPVDENDVADVDYVFRRIETVLPSLNPGTLVLVSSQLPVGSIRRLESLSSDASISFACSPENLRLGSAIDAFTNPDRIVVGIRNEKDRDLIEAVFRPWKPKIEWMSVESAEMTKHAVNAFMATSVAFINEVACICELVGADAKEVERGLKSESRIGAKAYLSPGAAFGGGTLARDISFLTQVGARHHWPTHLFAGVHASNDAHKKWAFRKLTELLGSVRGRCIAIWGLTYKPGTDTLRRSNSVELCSWLADQGARLQAHDPAIRALPAELCATINLFETPGEAVVGAEALVVATGWPDYKEIESPAVLSAMKNPIVLDPGRFLSSTLGGDPNICYVTIGRPFTHDT